MPVLSSAAECITSDGLQEVACHEPRKPSVEGGDSLDERVSVGDQADSSEASEGCDVLLTLSQTTPCHVEGGDGSAKKGNCQVAIEKIEAILNHVGENGQRSEDTSKGVKSAEHREESQDGAKPRLEEDEHDDMDGGWGYMVMLAAHIIMIMVAVFGPGFGILFADFLLEMKASSSITSAIFNTESFAWSVSNLLAGPLTEQFGSRPVAMVGGLLCCTGMVASAFAPSPSFLFLSHSMLTGFGSGASCLAAFAVVPHYFKRLLGRANGFITAGLCVGGMIGPPMVTYFQEQYGFKGATLIVASFTLHICLAGAMFRPVRKVSKVKESTGPRPGACQLMRQMVCSLARNCLLLKSPRVIIIALVSSFTVGIFLNLYMLVPFVMEARDHTQETAAWCMSVSNICNLVARLVVSSCSDAAWFNVLHAYIVFATLLPVSTIAFGVVEDVMWMTVSLAVCGTSVGACMFLGQMTMVRYMGLRLYVPVMGVVGMTNGLWIVSSGPLIGVLRDWSGSYTVSLCILGAFGFLSALFLLFLPAAVTYDKRKEEQRRVKDAEVGG